jgi:hypothetical protein
MSKVLAGRLILGVALLASLSLLLVSIPGRHTNVLPSGVLPSRAPGEYLLMPSSELHALPTSGPAWAYLVDTAASAWPEPDFNDPDSQADTLALAAGLVYARTADAQMRAKARDEIMAVIPTFDPARLREGLGPLRQTAGWVLAADLIGLEGADDAAFRGFLERVLSDQVGTHSRWNRVIATHNDAANNWGAWAGAARIAATLYLGLDTTDAANTVRGFLGDRTYWSGFGGQKDLLSDVAASWACNPDPAAFTPVNWACIKDGIDVNGAIPADISREHARLGRPRQTGIMYSLETLAGYSLQAELLYRNGYPDIYDFRAQAIRRMADFISRSGDAGGPGWNPGRVQDHIPWLLNRRYGTSYPTVPAQYGRSLGFTDWLYPSAGVVATPSVTGP